MISGNHSSEFVASVLNTSFDEGNDCIKKDSFEKAALRAQAIASIVFKNPELGTEERGTADILSRELAKIVGIENTRILVKKDVGPTKSKDGVLYREFTPIWGYPHMDFSGDGFMEYLDSEAEIGGVVAVMEGDNPEGPVIAIMCDLDALNHGHHCGHNAHVAGLVADAIFLDEYRNNGGTIPASKVAFIGRVNEEGLNPEKQFSDAQEMIDAGLIDIIGATPDVILSAHVLPSLSEGEIIIDRGATTHAAGFFSVEIQSQDSNTHIPPEIVMAKLISSISDTWEKDLILHSVPRFMKIGSYVDARIVKVSDSAVDSEKLDFSRRKPSKSIEMKIMPGQQSRILELWHEIDEWLKSWGGVQSGIELKEDRVNIHLAGTNGHIVEPGPNVEYLMAISLLHLHDGGVQWEKNTSDENAKLAGTIRIKNKKWKSCGKEILEQINSIVLSETKKLGYKGELNGTVVVPPVVNDPGLREILEVYVDNKLQGLVCRGIERLQAAYAEPLSFWQMLTGAKTILAWVGVGNPEEITESIETGSIMDNMQLHNENMIVLGKKVPYLGILGPFALEIAKKSSAGTT